MRFALAVGFSSRFLACSDITDCSGRVTGHCLQIETSSMLAYQPGQINLGSCVAPFSAVGSKPQPPRFCNLQPLDATRSNQLFFVLKYYPILSVMAFQPIVSQLFII